MADGHHFEKWKKMQCDWGDHSDHSDHSTHAGLGYQGIDNHTLSINVQLQIFVPKLIFDTEYTILNKAVLGKVQRLSWILKNCCVSTPTHSDILQNGAQCQNRPTMFPEIRKQRKGVTRIETVKDVFSTCPERRLWYSQSQLAYFTLCRSHPPWLRCQFVKVCNRRCHRCAETGTKI